ncbi:MAG: hypothetical protein DBW88_14765 [Pseudomonas sp.]|nr:MAG: hypothetical protein DBW88_14765 [Pseudomonas sp.]
MLPVAIGALLLVAGMVAIFFLPVLGVPASLLVINPAIKYTKSCCVGDTWMPEIRTDSLRA